MRFYKVQGSLLSINLTLSLLALYLLLDGQNYRNTTHQLRIYAFSERECAFIKYMEVYYR
jgi:hypothetical protein